MAKTKYIKTPEQLWELFEKYQKSNMPQETLQLAELLFTRFEKKYEGKVEIDNRDEYDELLWKLCLNSIEISDIN